MTSENAPTMPPMFKATVTCPDGGCAEAYSAVAELEQLEALICDCGCTLNIERLSESDDKLREDEAFELVLLG
jgi:hypothetical protein